MTNKNSKKGFTIIEVVLVLAIAGLIFLMVFIALPALQRSQRNTRRRQDMSRILSAINDYQTNNNGKLPWQFGADGKVIRNTDMTKDPIVTFIRKYVIGDANASQTGRSGSESCDGEQFCDPDGTGYWFDNSKSFGVGAAEAPTDGFTHIIYARAKAKCDNDNEGAMVAANGVNDTAIAYVLEGGAVYCGDNQ